MYITYNTLDYVIWGSGESKKESREDAKKWIDNWEKQEGPEKVRLSTCKADSSLKEPDGYCTWIIKNGIASLVEDPMRELRKVVKELEKLQKRDSQFS